MIRSVRAAVGTLFAVALLAGGLTIASPAGGLATNINVTPSTPDLIQANGFNATATLSGSCDATITESEVTFTFGGSPITDIEVSNLADGGFDFTIPPGLTKAGVATPLVVTVNCLVSTVPTTFTSIDIVWAEIGITKVVTGEAPADAVYSIEVVCGSPSPASISPAAIDQFTFELANGETGYLLFFTADTCTITETESQGATTSTVDPGSVTINGSFLFPVTVTNTFPEAQPKFTG